MILVDLLVLVRGSHTGKHRPPWDAEIIHKGGERKGNMRKIRSNWRKKKNSFFGFFFLVGARPVKQGDNNKKNLRTTGINGIVTQSGHGIGRGQWEGPHRLQGKRLCSVMDWFIGPGTWNVALLFLALTLSVLSSRYGSLLLYQIYVCVCV